MKLLSQITETFEHRQFIIKLVLKKMVSLRLDTKMYVTTRGIPYLNTRTAQFTIITEYDDNKPIGNQWCNSWFSNSAGVNTYTFYFSDLNGAIADIRGLK